jgi:hypothetical protein
MSPTPCGSRASHPNRHSYWKVKREDAGEENRLTVFSMTLLNLLLPRQVAAVCPVVHLQYAAVTLLPPAELAAAAAADVSPILASRKRQR